MMLQTEFEQWFNQSEIAACIATFNAGEPDEYINRHFALTPDRNPARYFFDKTQAAYEAFLAGVKYAQENPQ